MARPTAMDEHFVHQIPRAAPERSRPSPALAGELLLRRSTTRAAVRRRRLLHDGPLSGAGADGLAADGPGRRRAASSGFHDRPYDGDPHTTDVPRRPGRGRAAVRGDPPLGRSRRRPPSGSTSRSEPAPSRTGCAGARCGPATSWCGTSATSCSPGTYTGTYTVGRRDPRGRRVDRPARPLLGHPRPRPLPAVALVPDPARRRVPRRLALGVRQRRAASTPTAAGPAPTAATRSRSSTSSTTSTGSDADGRPVALRRARRRRRRPAPGTCRFALEDGRRLTVEADGQLRPAL